MTPSLFKVKQNLLRMLIFQQFRISKEEKELLDRLADEETFNTYYSQISESSLLRGEKGVVSYDLYRHLFDGRKYCVTFLVSEDFTMNKDSAKQLGKIAEKLLDGQKVKSFQIVLVTVQAMEDELQHAFKKVILKSKTIRDQIDSDDKAERELENRGRLMFCLYKDFAYKFPKTTTFGELVEDYKSIRCDPACDTKAFSTDGVDLDVPYWQNMERFFRIKRNQIRMMLERGYEIPDNEMLLLNEGCTVEDFEIFYRLAVKEQKRRLESASDSSSKKPKDLSDSVEFDLFPLTNTYLHSDESIPRCVFTYIDRDKAGKIPVELVRYVFWMISSLTGLDLTSGITEKGSEKEKKKKASMIPFKFIFYSEIEIQGTATKDLHDSMRELYHMEFFTGRELHYDVLRGRFSPKMKVLTPEEQREYLEQNKIQAVQHPYILSRDVFAKTLNIPTGTIVQVDYTYESTTTFSNERKEFRVTLNSHS